MSELGSSTDAPPPPPPPPPPDDGPKDPIPDASPELENALPNENQDGTQPDAMQPAQEQVEPVAQQPQEYLNENRVDGTAENADSTADVTQPDVSPELADALPDENTTDNADAPDRDSITLSPDRAAHILDGEDEYSGGHRAGTGNPDKTEFPENWTDEQVLDNVKDVALNPDSDPVRQSNGNWRYEGVRDDVHITTIVKPDGQIWTAWPREGDPGVVKNPDLQEV